MTTCQHTHRISYTDEGGRYARCQLCGYETLNARPLNPPPAPPPEVDQPRPATGGRNACQCGAAYRPYFGQWWRTGRGSVWVCSPACAPTE